MSQALLYPYAAPQIRGVIKTQPEDFKVDENLGFEPLGEGEHLFLRIEKTALSTFELIELLADDFAIKARDIGYSGLKDKQAVTRQWLSLYLPGKMGRLELPENGAYKILAQGWHPKKLRSGTHRGNRFEVLIRQVESFESATHQQIESIQQYGMANYFGRQRFGGAADNVSRALQVFGNARKTRKLSRNKRSLYMSALRSELFNQILSKRIESGFWLSPAQGDVFMLAGSQSIFQEAISDEILSRFNDFDISSAASLYGSGAAKQQAQALAIEQQVFEQNAEIVGSLLTQGAKLQMRATRIAVKNLKFDYEVDVKNLKIEAELPRGSYFTSLLDHFIDTKG